MHHEFHAFYSISTVPFTYALISSFSPVLFLTSMLVITYTCCFSGNCWYLLGLCFKIGVLSDHRILIVSVMHKQVCVQLTSNSKFLSKYSRKGLLGISDQKAPPMKNFRFEMTKVYSKIPPPPNEKLQIWDDQSLLWNTPPPPWKTSDLRWPKFTLKYPPSPPMKNFRFEMTKVYSEIPPPNEKLQIWDDQSLLWNTPPPRRFGIREIICRD